jgi:hypothetical protein
MAAQERDDGESTEGLAHEAEPAPAEGGEERPPEQQDTDRLEPPGASDTEPAAPPLPVGPGGTSVLPPVPGGPPPTPEQPRWAARAQVPTRRADEYADEWVTEPPRRLLVPVLLTIAVMLLLGVVATGVWLALTADGPPAPSPTTTPATGTPTATETTSPTTTPPTTTTSPSPDGIQVPDVSGQEYEAAAQTLGGLGFEPERVDIFSDTVPEGLVIGTSPPEGSTIAAGETVRVFVSLGPEPTEGPTETSTPTPTETEDEGEGD